MGAESNTGSETGYKSFEQKFLETKVGQRAVGLINHVGNSFYETVAAFTFRGPTAIRKVKNEQCYIGNEKPKGLDVLVDIAGGALGVFVSISYILTPALKEAIVNKNYAPMTIIGTIQAISLGYEAGRLGKSKKEHSELKARQAASKAKTD